MTKEQTNCDCKYPLGCGICKDLPPRPKTTRDQVYDILKSSKMLSDSLDEIDVFISKLISQEKEKCIKEEVFAFMHHLQEKANTVSPNLLLNEVVNYAYDRINLLQK